MTEQLSQQNLHFLTHILQEKLLELNETTTAKWGVMNVQQMAEHLTDFFDVSSGKKHYDLVTETDKLPLYIQFLWSAKEFRENTKAPENILGEIPLPARNENLQSAKTELLEAVNNFTSYFKMNTEKTIHPVFGALNFDEWLQLHAKNVRHHLRQFGLWE